MVATPGGILSYSFFVLDEVSSVVLSILMTLPLDLSVCHVYKVTSITDHRTACIQTPISDEN